MDDPEAIVERIRKISDAANAVLHEISNLSCGDQISAILSAAGKIVISDQDPFLVAAAFVQGFSSIKAAVEAMHAKPDDQVMQ